MAFLNVFLEDPLTDLPAHVPPQTGSENPLSHPLSKASPLPLPQAGELLDSAPSHCPSLNPRNEHKWSTFLVLVSGHQIGESRILVEASSPRNNLNSLEFL